MRLRIFFVVLITTTITLPLCESVLATDSADVLAMARAEVTATVNNRVLHSGAYGKLATLTFDYFHEHLEGGKLVDVILMLFDKAFEFADEEIQAIEIASWHKCRGRLYLSSGWLSEAEIDALQCLVTMSQNEYDPEGTEYDCMVVLANVYRAKHRLADARIFFEDALSMVDIGGGAYKGLVEVDQQLRNQNPPKDPAKHIQNLIEMGERMLVLANFDALGYFSDRVDIHFALFLLRHEMEHHVDAWFHVTVANQLAVNLLPAYDPKSLRYKLSSTRTVFNDHFFNGFDALGGHPTAMPIFIVGMLKSGSSLVEQILSSHSLVLGMGKESIFNGMLPKLREALVQGATHGVEAVQAAQNKFGSSIVQNMLSKSQAHFERSGFCEPEGDDELLDQRLMLAKCKNSSSVERVIDNMLFNHWNVGFIHFLYPNARIIHVTRDPMDTITEMYQHKVHTPGLTWTNNIGHLVREYAAYRKIMNHWDKILPNRVFSVHYDSLLENLEAESQRIIEHVGLGWEPRILEFHQTKHMVQMHASSKSSWREYADELKPFYKKLVKALGGKKKYAW